MSELGKKILKKHWKSKKKTENQCRNAACAQKTTSEKWTFVSDKTLGVDLTKNRLGKPFRKKSNRENWKNSKKQSEITACEQKTTCENANFCSNTVLTLYYKFRTKQFHAAKPLPFSLHFLFRCDQNHYAKLTSKIMKLFEQILKKRSRKNSGNDSKEKITHNNDLAAGTTLMKPKPSQMS